MDQALPRSVLPYLSPPPHKKPGGMSTNRKLRSTASCECVMYSPSVLRRSKLPLSTLKVANYTHRPKISPHRANSCQRRREVYVHTVSMPSFPSWLPSALPTALLRAPTLLGSYMAVPGTSPASSSRVFRFVSGTNRVVKMPQNMKRA